MFHSLAIPQRNTEEKSSSSSIATPHNSPLSHSVYPDELPPPPPPPPIINVDNGKTANDSQAMTPPPLLRTWSCPSLILSSPKTRRLPQATSREFPSQQVELHCHIVNILLNDQNVQVNNRDLYTARSVGASYLGKTFLGLTYQAAVGFAIFHYSSVRSSSSSGFGAIPLPLRVVGVATVLGFTASFSGILLRKLYPSVATIVEVFGSAATALGFFVMMGVFLSSVSEWIAWLAGIGCFITFAFVFVKMRSNALMV